MSHEDVPERIWRVLTGPISQHGRRGNGPDPMVTPIDAADTSRHKQTRTLVLQSKSAFIPEPSEDGHPLLLFIKRFDANLSQFLDVNFHPPSPLLKESQIFGFYSAVIKEKGPFPFLASMAIALARKESLF